MTPRARYIREHYFLRSTDAGVWQAVNVWPNGREELIEGADRAEVVRRARAHWGHFNFQDEAAAFNEIFPASWR